MNFTSKRHNKGNYFLLLATITLCFSAAFVKAGPKIAVLDFELRDLTLKPGIPQEVERTASVKPLLEAELSKSGFEIISIPLADQNAATAGFGYLFDHHDTAAQLAQKHKADYIIVGRLHKPSFLFVYLMAHLIDVRQQRLLADYLSEIKGGELKLTRKGVESLTVKINDTFKNLPKVD